LGYGEQGQILWFNTIDFPVHMAILCFSPTLHPTQNMPQMCRDFPAFLQKSLSTPNRDHLTMRTRPFYSLNLWRIPALQKPSKIWRWSYMRLSIKPCEGCALEVKVSYQFSIKSIWLLLLDLGYCNMYSVLLVYKSNIDETTSPGNSWEMVRNVLSAVQLSKSDVSAYCSSWITTINDAFDVILPNQYRKKIKQ